MTLNVSTGDGGAHELHMKTLVAGDRLRGSVIADGELQVEIIDDPPRHWIIVPPQRKYALDKSKLAEDAKYDPRGDLLKAEPDSFKFRDDSDEQVQFAPVNRFVLQPMEIVHEGGSLLRKFVATITSRTTGHVLTVTQWFLPDVWIVKRFSVVGNMPSGPLSIKGEATLIDFKPHIKESEFLLDMSSVEGFEKVNAKTLLGATDG